MKTKIAGLPIIQAPGLPVAFSPSGDFAHGRAETIGASARKHGVAKSPAPPPRIIRVRDVIVRTGLARTTIWTYCAAGKFPQPIKLGPNATGWLESEIEAWIEGRISERGAV